MIMEAVLHGFYSRLRSGIAAGRRCGSCGAVSFPPRGLCPRCGSGDGEWFELKGTGTMLFASAGPNLLLGKPYVMATVALAEGPVISGPLLDDFDFTRPEAVWDYNGANVTVRIEIATHESGGAFVAFKRAAP